MNFTGLQNKTRALLAVLQAKDLETSAHTKRVSRFALRLGDELMISGVEREYLRFGSILHDVGKIMTQDRVLKKPGALSELEMFHMREHAFRGAELLSNLKFPYPVIRIVLEHHERWDGAGYPRGLFQTEISMGARVFAVADTFDAIISDRCYRQGNTYEAAAEEIARCSSSQFDPGVGEAFFKIEVADWERLARPKIIARQAAGATGGEKDGP